MLTAVIASYNHSKYIVECLENIVQVKQLKKVLVIDDGSTDGTPALVSKFITDNHFEDLINLITKPNAGLVDSLNLGLKLCDTEYVYFTASDDYINASGFNQLLTQISPKSGCVIGGALNVFLKAESTSVYTQKHIKFFKLSKEKLRDEIFLNYPHPILIQSTIFKADLLRKLGGWDSDLVLDDYSIFVKILCSEKENPNVSFIPDIIICNYRHHGNNSYKKNLWLFSALSDVIKKYAPQKIKNRAIGKSAVYYLYNSLRCGQLIDFLSIVRKMNLVMLGNSVVGIMKKLRHRSA